MVFEFLSFHVMANPGSHGRKIALQGRNAAVSIDNNQSFSVAFP
jgi:hypothetical protein